MTEKETLDFDSFRHEVSLVLQEADERGSNPQRSIERIVARARKSSVGSEVEHYCTAKLVAYRARCELSRDASAPAQVAACARSGGVESLQPMGIEVA